MSLENVERFERLLKEDEELQAKLAAATKAYDGAETDEAMFEELLAPIAAGVGLPFTLDEALAHASTCRNLSDSELDAVAGGSTYCYIVVGGSEPDAGYVDYENGGACAYVGLGLAIWD